MNVNEATRIVKSHKQDFLNILLELKQTNIEIDRSNPDDFSNAQILHDITDYVEQICYAMEMLDCTVRVTDIIKRIGRANYYIGEHQLMEDECIEFLYLDKNDNSTLKWCLSSIYFSPDYQDFKIRGYEELNLDGLQVRRR